MTPRKNMSLLLALSLTCVFCIVLMVSLKSDDMTSTLTGRYEVPLYSVDMMYGHLPRYQRHSSIGIIEVVRAYTSPEEYHTAMMSVACYAKIHNYDFHVIKDNSYSNLCRQKDRFFRRHCIVACALKDYDYILFLDSDIGVVNPGRIIEDFIDPKVDITFYDRFYNWEIMAGSYLVKNSNWAIEFLHGFANYESRVPNNVLGSDNGALHAYLAEVLYPNSTQLPTCLLIYKHATGYGSLFLYEACIRDILRNKTSFGNVAILHKGTAWARDHIMTNSKWSNETDFMIHNWKTKHMRTYEGKPIPITDGDRLDFSAWYSPFAGAFDLRLCKPRNRTWHYDVNLIAPPNLITAQMGDYEKKVDKTKDGVLIYLPRILQMSNHGRDMRRVERGLGELLSTMNQTWEAYAP